jgi:hypothetical protein
MKIMAIIQNTTYIFNRLTLISNDYYETLKEILTLKPEYHINPQSSFIETFKGELKFLGIGAVSFLIVSLDLTAWLNWVGGIAAFFSFFSFVPSLSYLGFISDKSSYYGKLKSDIIKSNNYAELTNL